jgi:hypothetical protein
MVWGRGFGWGLGAGFLGGAIIGGARAAPYYYYRPYYLYGAPSYPPAACLSPRLLPGAALSSAARLWPGYYPPAPAYRGSGG